MKIALISCSKNKKDNLCRAIEMYSKSTLFKKTYQYCLKNGYDKIFVLSAKYGILEPEEFIEPYELTLSTFTKKQKEDWAKSCFLQLKKMGLIWSDFDFYCGTSYFDSLSKFLDNSHNVMRGLGIGHRLKFLSK